MNGLDISQDTITQSRSTGTARTLNCLPAGMALGALDLLAQRYFAYPWASLANSPAIWAVTAFLLGLWIRSSGRSAIAGAVMLLFAVLTYYLTAAALLGDDLNDAAQGAAIFWYMGAIGIGLIAGLAGALSQTNSRWPAVCGAAFLPALLAAEASIDLGALLATIAAVWAAVTLALLLRGDRAVLNGRVATAARFVGVTALMIVIGHFGYLAVGLHGFHS